MNYNSLKRIASSVLPKGILIKYEPFLRRLLLFCFRGSNNLCNICGSGLKQFIILEDNDLLCPFCGSRSRTRALFNFLEEKNLLHGTVLHFSPSRSLYRKFSKNERINYISTDYADEFIADHRLDICNLDLENNSADLILCFHILEHVMEDQKAMRELCRVLKSTGFCLIQTPFKEGDIYEDAHITDPHERLKAFGQGDHVRVYSVEGLRERFVQNGFEKVEILNITNVFLGIPNQRILLAQNGV